MSDQKLQKKGALDWYFKSNLLFRILIGLVLGVVAGIALGFMPDAVKGFTDIAKPFGDIFVRLLRMIVVPVIFLSLVAGAASIAPNRLGRVGVKIMAYYLLTSAFAVVIGLVFANIFKPGMGMGIVGAAGAAGKAAAAPTLVTVLLNIIPTNPIDSLAKGDVLPIIFFAVVFGIAVAYVKDSKDKGIAKAADTVLDVANGAVEAMYKVVAGIMQYAPIGVFVLIAIVFAQQGAKALGPLFMVTLTVYLGLILHLVGVYGGFLAINKFGLFKFLKRANEAMITAFVTRSSGGTLPITLRNTEDNMGVPRSISSFHPAPGRHHQYGRHRHLPGRMRHVHRLCHRPAAHLQPAAYRRHHRHPGLHRHGGRTRRRRHHAPHGARVHRAQGNRRLGGGYRLRHDPGHRRPPGHGTDQPQRYRRHGRHAHRGQERKRARHGQVGLIPGLILV
jgi:Na+/H+-dicarboxylate symporter